MVGRRISKAKHRTDVVGHVPENRHLRNGRRARVDVLFTVGPEALAGRYAMELHLACLCGAGTKDMRAISVMDDAGCEPTTVTACSMAASAS